jgi:signal transduction histidine kinase
MLIALYVAGFAIMGRLLITIEDYGLLPWYLALLAAFLLLFSVIWVRPGMAPPQLHLVLATQCLVVLAVLALEPEFDFVTALFVPLAYQAALVFSGRARWIWIGSLVFLIGASLMVALGPLRGLGLAMTSMAVAIAFPALAMASREIELARADSQNMVAELEATHQRLEEYATQADELAVMEERNRLARELHDSVSQAMFSILLATRSAQIMQQKEPDGVSAQLEQLQELTQEALVRMRGFIAELRPKAC